MFYCREEELQVMNRRYDKGGFTPALLEAEKQGEVTLLTLDDLYE